MSWKGESIGYRHMQIGPVHEVIVDSSDIDSLRDAITHERDTCRAPRFVIDLTALESLDDEHFDVLVTMMADHPAEEWVVRLSEPAADAASRAERGDVTVITGTGPHGPTDPHQPG